MKKGRKVKMGFDKMTIAKLSNLEKISINGGRSKLMEIENASKTPPCELGLSVFGAEGGC